MNQFHSIGQRYETAFALFLFIFGLTSTITGWHYGVGQLNDIGPGAFPMGLGIIMCGLAILSAREAGQSGPLARKLAPMLLIPPGIIIWALLIDRAGLLVSTVILMLFCAFAEEQVKLVYAIILAFALTLIGYIVFVLGFGLRFDVLVNWK